MNRISPRIWAWWGPVALLAILAGVAHAEEPGQQSTSYSPVDIK